jgi:pimeloyl-ACP methyl ester carboxylesterase
MRSACHYGSFSLLILLTVFAPSIVTAEWPKIAISSDGNPISYEVYGAGEPTLVFVHGWSCDARYWHEQIPYFSKQHRMVILDLAGHGHSGSTRTRYTMKSFGEDVLAVTEAIGSRVVILIGHSMGGSVIAEAARLMPDRVIGLIGVDTLENIEYPMTPDEFAVMIEPLEDNFSAGTRKFIEEMMLPSSDQALREWILADISAAPKSVALSAIREMMSQYITGEAAKIFDEIKVPVIVVKSDMWPVDYAANRRHMASFEALVLKHADHFLMMNRPDEFNHLLDKAIGMISKRPAKQQDSH